MKPPRNAIRYMLHLAVFGPGKMCFCFCLTWSLTGGSSLDPYLQLLQRKGTSVEFVIALMAEETRYRCQKDPMEVEESCLFCAFPPSFSQTDVVSTHGTEQHHAMPPSSLYNNVSVYTCTQTVWCMQSTLPLHCVCVCVRASALYQAFHPSLYRSKVSSACILGGCRESMQLKPRRLYWRGRGLRKYVTNRVFTEFNTYNTQSFNYIFGLAFKK